ncbi:MAG TPA: hypothetical protein VFG50_14755 [Rhodothermales bacterium]|nr:hypothetical protein [Rhodothermales bacterium]
MGLPARPLSEINEQAIRVLVREMGAADAARFISQFTTGYGDYTKERKDLFKDLTLENAVRQIRGGRQENR